MVKVPSRGKLGSLKHEVRTLSDRCRVAEQPKEIGRPGLAYGMMSNYGDVCLNPDGALLKITGLDHFIGFDSDSGRLVSEAGLLPRYIQRLVISRGWILPVTPDTQLVTVSLSTLRNLQAQTSIWSGEVRSGWIAAG